MLRMRYFGDQNNTSVINTRRHDTCPEKLPYCTDNILFQHALVALKEPARETIRAGSFERTDLKQRVADFLVAVFFT